MSEAIIVIPQQLGPILKGYRQKLKMTQAQAGAKAGLPQNAISLIETNAGSTSLERLAKILSALELEFVIRPRSKPTDQAW